MTDHDIIERDIAQYLSYRGYLVLRTHGPRNRPKEDGIPDLICVPLKSQVEHRTLWIEVKGSRGRLSIAQADMHKCLTERGQRVIVARNVADVEGV